MAKNSKMKKGWLLTLSIFIASLVIPVSLGVSYTGVDKTITSFQFPNGFIKREFNSSQPWLEYSFFIRNFNRIDLSVEIDFSVDILYYRFDNNQVRSNILKIRSNYHHISYQESLSVINNATYEYFNLVSIQNFQNYGNYSRPYGFLMYAELKGYYLLGLISFTIKITDMNITDYEL